jgi:acyl-CoA-binding protein
MGDPKQSEPNWLELERRIPVAEAAHLKGISEDTFRRRYSHLIEQVSPRRQAVKIKHVISD